MRNKVIKSILYRVFSFTLGQAITWVILRKLEFNFLVASIDLIQTLGYYVFEKIWERQEK